LVGLILVTCLLPGCFISNLIVEKPIPPPIPPADELPDDIPSLLDLANREIEEQATVEELAIAVAALQKAAALVDEKKSSKVDKIEIQLQLAIACFLASELEPDASIRLSWIAEGEKAAEKTQKAWPERVEGYYYLAVLKGRRAEQGGLSGIGQVKDIEELALKAAEMDATFEDGGAYRMLALLYLNAPPWPTSLGDIDLAIEYAKRAVEISDYPLNHLFYGEVLIEDEEFVRAREELRGVISAPKTGRWATEGEHWRSYARKLLKEIERP
jgi:tetratricopeptide (TPR) repeat protein